MASTFCSFCHGRNPHDKAKYTHNVKDATGKISCPFVDVSFCGRCFQQGHTARHCTYDMDMMQVQMEAGLSLDPEQFDRLPYDKRFFAMMARDKLDWERMMFQHRKTRYNYINGIMRWQIPLDQQFFEKKCCRYCYNNNPNDQIFLTHKVGMCPRLACHKCAICGEKGHTQAKCEKPMVDKLVAEQGDMWVDFNDADDEM